jgi:pimeloyl-ACP methyl ester carboxylesterase
MHSHTIRVDGILTHYLEAGERSADKLVLVHDGAFGADGWATWSPVLPRLAERFHVLVPDLLGFGGTQKIYDFGQGARGQKIEHVAAWMKAIGLDAAHFMGNSAGGSMVLIAAMRAQWPIRKAISVAGTGGPFMRNEAYGPLRDYAPGKEAMRRIVELMVSRRDGVMETLVEERYKRSLVRGHWENLSAPRLRPPGPAGGQAPEGTSVLDGLAGIAVPVLLVAGSDDALLEPGWQQRLASRIPGARTLVVENARHQPQFDAPQVVCDAVESFLAS